MYIIKARTDMLFQTRSHHPSLHKSIEFKLSGYVQHIFDIQSFVFFLQKRGAFFNKNRHTMEQARSHTFFLQINVCVAANI